MADDARKIFTKNLNALLSVRGLSQVDIIRTLGVPSATVSSWCTGKKYPRIDVMQRLADMLSVGLSDLISETGLEAVADRDRLALISNNAKLKRLVDVAADMSDEDVDLLITIGERMKRS